LDANESAANFIRSKIREIVEDPAVADLLTPRGYPLGAKRTVVGHNYYATYNRPNVTLVDASDRLAAPHFTKKGIVVDEREIELDVVLLATGFDAYTGA